MADANAKMTRRLALAGRLTIIGGGVMGLMTAYYAAPLAEAVTVLERSRVGDPATASFGLTRSVRNDYRDPAYARLAFEARQLWRELERESGERLLIDCGCLNLVKSSVTPDLDSTYAVQSYAVLEQLRLRREVLSRARLRERFPQFDADGGWLDVEAGFADLAAVTRALRKALRVRGVTLAENTEPQAITRRDQAWVVAADGGPVESDALVITAGMGTNDVLGLVPGCSARFPLRPDRPSQSKYFIPPASSRHMFTESVMPVFGYLDIGIYGHPLYDGKTPGVKIGFYNPPGVTRTPSRIGSVEDFVAECLPGLRGAEVVDVAASGVDTCWYDLVADDEFILGAVPGTDDVFTGVGWRGTGYKFAPWVGKVLAQLAVQRGTVYDIGRFTPARFAGGAAGEPLAGGVAS
jgi:glycine/D-amino acid oxidase-like deaminating enzyme